MTTKTENPPKELTLTRILDAPRELVWKAWTDEKMMTEWWMPHGFINSECELDPRPGGVFKIRSDAPGFPNHKMSSVFKEVKKPEKLVFSSSAFTNESGEDPGLEITNTITFEDVNGKTKLTVHALVTKYKPGFEAALNGMNQGWSESLDKLTVLLSKSKK